MKRRRGQLVVSPTRRIEQAVRAAVLSACAKGNATSLLAIPTRKLKLEQVALGSASSDRQEKLVSTEAGLRHPGFTNKSTLAVDSEPDDLHCPVTAPRPERHVRH